MKGRAVLERVTPYPDRVRVEPGSVRLDLNESVSGCSEKVMDALASLSPRLISEYPDVSGLRQSVCEKFSLNDDQIALTNGGDEAIRYALDAFVDKKDRVVLTDPGFSIYTQYAGLREADVLKVPLNGDFSFPDQLFIDASKEAVMCVVVNPNSPTGTAVSRERIVNILKSLPDTLVLLDEAYTEFRNASDMDLIADYPNLLVLRSLSKAYGLAGLRLGFLAGDPSLINSVKRVSAPFNVNSVAAVLGQEALKDKEFLRKTVTQTRRGREYLTLELSKLGLKVLPSDSNFVTVYCGEICDEVYEALMKQGFLVKILSSSSRMEGWLRITVGTEEQNRSIAGIISGVCSLEAVLFDMDGVLVDVSQSYRKAISETVEYFTGKQVTDSDIEALKKQGGFNCDWALTARLIENAGINVPFIEVKTVFQRFYLGGDRKPGLIDSERWLVNEPFLKELRSQYRLGIVTGRPKEEAVFALEKAGLKDCFESVITRDDTVERGKPDPLGLQMALKQLNVRRAVYVGDNVDDMKAASSAGIPSIGVETGEGSELIQSGAYAVITITEELNRCLK